MKFILMLAVSSALAISAIACQDRASRDTFSRSTDARDVCSCGASVAPSSAPTHVDVPTTGVTTITLPVIETELPPGPGKLTLVSTCTLCHSPRYVTMQPNFSRKKWTEEVDKMKKVYGAPIQDEQIDPIVNYLVAIRGNGQ